MSLKCGIVGLPNVGKSTLFNALTKAGIAAENYPFCTIEPNVGIVELPDPRLAQLAAIVKPERIVPAIVEFVDIAGLVAGASKGEGLGNQFLAAHPRDRRDRQRRALLRRRERDPRRRQGRPDRRHRGHPDRAVPGRPGHRREGLARYDKVAKAGSDKEAQRLVDVLQKCDAALTRRRPVRGIDFSKEEQVVLKPLCLITAKPAMFVGNVDEDGFENNPLPRPPARVRRATECAGGRDLRQDRGRARRHGRRGPAAVPGRDGADRAGPEPADPRRLQAARPADLLHRRREGSARLDDPRRRHRAAGGRRDPHRLRARLHPRPDDRLSPTSSPARASRAPRTPARCAPKARSTSSRTATC